MRLPFTVEQFLNVFAQYNQAIWPLQLIAYLLAILAIGLLLKHSRYSDRLISAALAFFWLVMGIGYHGLFFSAINKVAYIFGLFFVIQGLLLLISGVIKEKISYGFSANLSSLVGIVLILYAMLGYPLLGQYLGHSYPRSPVFGVAPCPTTIYTFGLLLLTTGKLPKYLLMIPLIWSLIGFSAALNLGIIEDTGLLIAGLAGTLILWVRDHNNKQTVKVANIR